MIARRAGRRTEAFMLCLALAIAAGALWAPRGAAETRVALIIGNSAYERADMRLANPANDAAAMVRSSEAAGFDTVVGTSRIPNTNTFIVTRKLGTGAWLRK